jgi:hypothetical protein
MSKVHFINKIAPMPPLATVEGSGRRLQGGLPPVPFRSASSKWASCPTKWAREPYASRAIKFEVLQGRKDLE